ncbi:MAG: phosphohistidine phosphatase SixA [Xenococcaceae cyanobacterium]
MEVYLIRHGLAGEHGDYEDDNLRPLTDEGRKKTAKVAKRLSEIGVRFDIILTSPLTRASQTAEIMQKAGLGDRLEEFVALSPDGSIETWVEWYKQWCESNREKTIALVGHQPNLGNWAEILVWGKSKQKMILKKAGIVGLLVPELKEPIGSSELFVLTSPKWLLQ